MPSGVRAAERVEALVEDLRHAARLGEALEQHLQRECHAQAGVLDRRAHGHIREAQPLLRQRLAPRITAGHDRHRRRLRRLGEGGRARRVGHDTSLHTLARSPSKRCTSSGKDARLKPLIPCNDPAALPAISRHFSV